MSIRWKRLPAVLITTLSTSTFAHEGERHVGSASAPAETSDSALTSINADYLKSVKPIFRKKCMDCHSENTRYPWYHRLPLVKTMIDKDIAESRKHIDMTGDFPFKSHGSPPEDLKAIASSIQEGTMPPHRYRLMHPSATITQEEKLEILSWVERSRKKLQAPTKQE